MRRRKLSFVTGNCPTCGSSEVIEYTEGSVCGNCGVILREGKRSYSTERLGHPVKEDEVREVGQPLTPLLADRGLQTRIGSSDRGGRGDMKRLRKWHDQLLTADRDLVEVLDRLKRYQDSFGLPSRLVLTAAQIFRKARERGLIKGRNKITFATACLFLSVRLAKYPLSLKEISELSGIPQTDLSRDLGVAIKELKLKVPPTDPVRFVKKICFHAEITKEDSYPVIVNAVRILRLAEKKRLTAGKEPPTLAAGAIYYSCQLLGVDRGVKQIAEAAGVSQNSVRYRYKELRDELQIAENAIEETEYIETPYT